MQKHFFSRDIEFNPIPCCMFVTLDSPAPRGHFTSSKPKTSDVGPFGIGFKDVFGFSRGSTS